MTLTDFGITEPKLFALIILYSLLFFLILAAVLVLFYLKGYGIYIMSRKLNIKRSWYGFVPFANIFAFGRLADISAKGKGMYRKALTVTYILSFIFMVAYSVLSINFAVKLLFAADAAVFAEKSLDPKIFNAFIPALAFLGIALILTVVYRILSAVCAVKIYKRFNTRAPYIKAVFGFIIPLLLPCFLYSVCKNDPIDKSVADNDDGYNAVFKIDG